MDTRSAGPESPKFEDYPLTRPEYITVLTHFYRGEMHRSSTWRQRLDATTNWAVLTCAGVLSFSFASKEHPHIVLLLSNLIIIAYLVIEARRYRYFAVYRARVRMLEENFLVPIITRRLSSPLASWRDLVAADLDMPKFKTSLLESIGFRLQRNYGAVFLILFGGWLLKLAIHPEMAVSFTQMWERMAVGVVPSVVVFGGALGFYLLLAGLIMYVRSVNHGEPPDEVSGVEGNAKHWPR